MPAVLYEKTGRIAFITLNRQDVRNAMDAEVIVRLAEAKRAIIPRRRLHGPPAADRSPSAGRWRSCLWATP